MTNIPQTILEIRQKINSIITKPSFNTNIAKLNLVISVLLLASVILPKKFGYLVYTLITLYELFFLVAAIINLESPSFFDIWRNPHFHNIFIITSILCYKVTCLTLFVKYAIQFFFKSYKYSKETGDFPVQYPQQLQGIGEVIIALPLSKVYITAIPFAELLLYSFFSSKAKYPLMVYEYFVFTFPFLYFELKNDAHNPVNFDELFAQNENYKIIFNYFVKVANLIYNLGGKEKSD